MPPVTATGTKSPAPAEPTPDTVTPVSDVTAAASDPTPDLQAAASTAGGVGQSYNTVALATDALASILQSAVISPVQTLAQFPGLVVSGVDVITALEQTLTSMTGDMVTTVQRSADLLTLLSTGATVPAPNALPAGGAYRLTAAPKPAAPALLPAAPAPSGPSGPALLDEPTITNPLLAPVADSIVFTNWAQATTPAQAPTPEATQTSVLAQLPGKIAHAIREALQSVSLADLALAALPGIAGLVFFYAAGIGVGRRQAKFGFMMHLTGVARFARLGPLGVVRSGSLVAVPRSAGVAPLRIDKAA